MQGGCTLFHASDRSPTLTASSTSARQGRYVPDLYDLYDLYDLHDLAHVAGWELCNLHHLPYVSWVGSVLDRPCTTYHNGRLGSTVYDLDRDPPVRRVKVS